MASANIVSVWREGNTFKMAVRVAEPEGKNIEYIGSVKATPEFLALSKAEQKAQLGAACKAERDRQRPSELAVIGITGTVAL